MSTADISPSVPAPPQAGRPPIPWPLVITIGLMVCACLPWLALYAQTLWVRPHYEFFPMVLLGALALGIRAWQDGLGQLTPGSAGVRNVLLWLAFLLLVVCSVVFSPWLGAIASLVLLVGIIWSIGGALLWRALLPAWLFLWLGIRPPNDIDLWLVSKLQTITAGWTSSVLDVLCIIHVLAGNVIEIVGQRLLVEEACSGIHSLFSVLTCTLFLLIWFQRRIVPSILLVIAGIGWVLVANVARVVAIVILATRWGIDVSTGWTHWFFGWLPFVVVLSLVWSTDRLLLFFFAKRSDPLPELEPATADAAGQPAARENPTLLPEPRAIGLSPLPLGVAFGALAALEIVLCWPTTSPSPSGHFLQNIEGMTAETLPARIGAWQRTGFEGKERKGREAELGLNSRQWVYKLGTMTGVLSIDYPFVGFHYLPRCYLSQGWAIDELTPHSPAAEGDDYFISAHYHKPLQEYGSLWYLMMDEQLRSIPMGASLSEGELRLLTARKIWTRLVQREEVPVASYQVQLFLDAYAPLNPQEQAQAQDLFRKSVGLLRKSLGNP